jgi:predicted alpha/beta hydrolase family esterase
MKTLILPGFSIKNKEWAEQTQRELSKKFNCEVVYWKHWETGQKEDHWIEKEAVKIIEDNKEPINIIAKSIGTAVVMFVIKKTPNLIHKIILCGIPLNDLEPGEENIYEVLRTLQPKTILCIQNDSDPHGGFQEVEKIIHSIEPSINIISKQRDDHEYPYTDDFIQFIQDTI